MADSIFHVTKLTGIKPGEYVAAWWDVHVSEETGRPLHEFARRRAELAGVID